MPLSHWQAWGIDHLSRKLSQCLTTLKVKKCFLMSPETALNHLHLSCHWIPGRRDQNLPLPFPSSGSRREQGHLSASLFPRALSCSSQDTPSSPSTSFVSSSAHIQRLSHPTEMVRPRTPASTPGEAAPTPPRVLLYLQIASLGVNLS